MIFPQKDSTVTYKIHFEKIQYNDKPYYGGQTMKHYGHDIESFYRL